MKKIVFPRLGAEYKPLIIIIAAEIILYYAWLEFLNPLIKAPFFFSQVLLFVFLVIFLLVFIGLLKYKINFEQLDKIISLIDFSGHHPGTDGLCCFLSKRVEDIPFTRHKDILLLRVSFTQEPDIHESLKEIIKNYEIEIFSYYERCEQLGLHYEIREGRLIFAFGCQTYESRPAACRDYPYPERQVPCRLGQYCSSPCQQVEYLQWSYMFFYAFDSQKFPDLKAFAVGSASNLIKKYYLVPVPFQLPDNGNIYC